MPISQATVENEANADRSTDNAPDNTKLPREHKATIDAAFAEEPGDAPFWLRFIQVRDIHTQKVVVAFQDTPFVDSDWGDEVQPYGKEEKGAEKYWRTLPTRTKALE